MRNATGEVVWIGFGFFGDQTSAEMVRTHKVIDASISEWFLSWGDIKHSVTGLVLCDERKCIVEIRNATGRRIGFGLWVSDGASEARKRLSDPGGYQAIEAQFRKVGITLPMGIWAWNSANGILTQVT